MSSNYATHADLLDQVEHDQATRDEVRRILAPLTDAELTTRNSRRQAEVDAALATTRRYERTMRQAFREWPESAMGIAGPVITPCSGWGRMVLAVKRWLRGAR